jgi:hypothetical protein
MRLNWALVTAALVAAAVLPGVMLFAVAGMGRF